MLTTVVTKGNAGVLQPRSELTQQGESIFCETISVVHITGAPLDQVFAHSFTDGTNVNDGSRGCIRFGYVGSFISIAPALSLVRTQMCSYGSTIKVRAASHRTTLFLRLQRSPQGFKSWDPHDSRNVENWIRSN